MWIVILYDNYATESIFHITRTVLSPAPKIWLKLPFSKSGSFGSKKNLLINFLLTYCCQRELSSVVPWSAWFSKLYITLSEIVKKSKQKKTHTHFFLRNVSLSQIFGAWLKTVLVMWKMDSVAWFSYYMTIHMSYFQPKKKTEKKLLPP